MTRSLADTGAPSPPRRGGRSTVWVRALLAGPCAAVLRFLVFAALPFCVPKGAGGVDHIAFPLFFMPAGTPKGWHRPGGNSSLIR